MKKVLLILSIIIIVIFCNCNNSADDPQAKSQPTKQTDSSLHVVDTTAVIDSARNN